MPKLNNKLLIVESDLSLKKQISGLFENNEVIHADDSKSALDKVKTHQPAVVCLDLDISTNTENTESFITLQQILEIAPATKVIVVNAQTEENKAVKALTLGAYDFCSKPFQAEVIALKIKRAFQLIALEEQNNRLKAAYKEELFEGVIACSPQMQEVCRAVEKIGPSDATVLLLGEIGTGKELCARGLHNNGRQSKGEFVTINCAAIPDAVLESELFGSEKADLTGATKKISGKIERADGGTLFLDEISDMPIALQARFMRFLQERVVERVGDYTPIPVNVRIICATHQNLRQKIESGEFREDLFYRICEIPLEIPPLRNREGDIIVLARYFFEQFNTEQERNLVGFTQDAITSLEAYAWPGNVRELKNRIKRAVIMTDAEKISASDLELDKEPMENMNFRLVDLREKVERQAVIRAMSHSNGRVAPAAELLGVSRPTLYDLIKKLNISV